MSVSVNINGDCDINDTLYAPACKFGSDLCNIQVKKINGEKKMLVTLPNKYNREGKNNKETYDMRSIIESIQELNRRTATISCNRKFLDSLDICDINNGAGPFACSHIEDGLPAAQSGSVNIDSS